MTLNENVNSAADEQKAKLDDGVAGEGVALSNEDLEQVNGGVSVTGSISVNLPLVGELVNLKENVQLNIDLTSQNP